MDKNIAREWDDVYREIPENLIPWSAEKIPESLVESAEKAPKGKALDVCCGAGLASVFLAKKGFRVKGIDISQKAIEIAKKRAEAEDENVDFSVGDVTEIDDRNEYNLVFDRGCFHHMSEKEKREFAKTVHLALKDGGKYHLMAFSERNNFDKDISKSDIHRYFGRLFEIGEIKEEAHREPTGRKVYLYSAVMTKKQDPN